MGRYTGPVCRLCRREGNKLFLKGERCYSDKCAVERKSYAPGDHGSSRRKPSEYGMQLREKQKVRRIYGIMESQFKMYFEKADNAPGVTGENFLALLERRLDNVIFRLGFAASRNEARQIVQHGHVLVNGRKLDIASYIVKVDDKIEIKESSKDMKRLGEVIELNLDKEIPAWLDVNFDNKQGKVLAEPEREDVKMPINEQLIVEFYSR